MAAYPEAGDTDGLRALLALHLEWGVDAALTDSPYDRFARAAEAAPARPQEGKPPRRAAPPVVSAPATPLPPAGLPDELDCMESLSAALAAFDGCSLRRTAMHTVLAEGPAGAPVMIIGDAPDADEDRSGRPFSGQAGALLDGMLGSIGLARGTLAVAAAIPWRPPGGRPPSAAEIEVCLPLLHRTIGLMRPQRLLLCGSLAARMVTGRTEPLARLRNVWHGIPLRLRSAEGVWQDAEIPALVMRHPLQLKASAAARRESWADILRLSVATDETS
ncbi:uracil-DNA glycosylase [Acetobacter sp. AN02]|uniref:uracil-DNA glycosylase n=1 Tax=Acetobacter sp. AN02 TaxID=2894186 RepID=UPI002434166C|nr:uracil-DNA glycosylase [Acetobacter sp. AN02]MDG6094922.1 uracil-DNA glycosylase [Acetobacter sp. AN02]